jgi:hypothetical protein
MRVRPRCDANLAFDHVAIKGHQGGNVTFNENRSSAVAPGDPEPFAAALGSP